MTTTLVDLNQSLGLDHDIPVRLKALRHALGISAANLDRQAGFTLGTTGRLERGDQRIYAAHLFHIANVTGITVQYFYTSENDAQSIGAATSEELEKHRLLQAYMKIKDLGLKRDVFELVETLAKDSGSAEL